MPNQEMGPERLTPKGLPSARRGYDRKAVERLFEEAQLAWAALQEEHRRLLAEIDRAGGLDYLARDLGAVGGDVGRLLGDAQEASRGLRERARVDSTERLAAAEVEARRLLAEAEEQAFQLRANAWATGMDLLRQAVETGRGMVREAGVEVLSIRAGAEQEAHRLVASARRESQDLLREARFAAERAMLEARVPAEQPAPIEPVVPGPPAAASPPEAATGRRRRHAPEVTRAEIPYAIRVIQPAEGPRAAARPGIDPGSYGDAMAAEVEALWESGEVEALPPVPEPVPPVRPGKRAPVAKGPAPVTVKEPAEAPVTAEPKAAAGLEEPVTEPPKAEAVTEEPAGQEAAEQAAREGATQAEAEVEAAPPPAVPSPLAEEVGVPQPAPGVVEELFARLRGTHHAPAPGSGRRRGRGVSTPGETLPGLGPAVPAATLATARGTAPDAVELRERLVLPVQNRALRGVKESLLELQNSALDALRVSGAWEGSGPALAALAPALDPVAEEGAEAGAQAAAAFTGGEPPAPVITARSAALVQAMADEFGAQVGAALDEASGAGPLEVAAAVSRVFRAWRAEEAEHWVRTVAYAAYHDSLLAGLAVAGVRSVSPVAHGLLCPECPAFRGMAWDPGGEPPAGTARPPVHSNCVCTVGPT